MPKLDLRHWLAGGIAVLFSIAGTIVWRLSRSEAVPVPSPAAFQAPIDCAKTNFPRQPIAMPDDSMAGVFQKGQRLTLVRGWYRCNPVKRGDVVYFRFTAALESDIRKVRAAPGDKFKLGRAPAGHPGWTLDVNGERLKRGNDSLVFGSAADPMIGLYERAHPGGLLGKVEAR